MLYYYNSNLNKVSSSVIELDWSKNTDEDGKSYEHKNIDKYLKIENLEESLKFLYQFGVLGNLSYNEKKNKTFTYWSYHKIN